MSGSASRRRGLTLVELAVVVGILAVLIGLLLPGLAAARRAAAKAQCGARLKELGSACWQYADLHGRLPPLRMEPVGPDSKWSFSWTPHLLPFVEAAAAESFNFSTPIPEPHDFPAIHANATVGRSVFAALLCPADGNAAINYRACSGADSKLEGYEDSHLHGAFTFAWRRRLREFRDGLSNSSAFSDRLGGSGQSTEMSVLLAASSLRFSRAAALAGSLKFRITFTQVKTTPPTINEKNTTLSAQLIDAFFFARRSFS